MDSETRMTGPVRVEDVTTSKKGTSYRVRLGDNWYGSDMKSGINDALGKMIVADISSDFGGWIKRWKMAADQTLPSGARPVTTHLPHQEATKITITETGGMRGPIDDKPARKLSAEELKVVNGLTMGIVQHWLPAHDGSYTDKLELIQLAMKAIATTVREL